MFITTQSFQSNSSGFKLASGAISPYYVDCRLLIAHPGPRQLVVRLAVELLKNIPIQCIGGLEIGAIALATAISDYGLLQMPRREWRTFVVRKQPKDHGPGRLIEGAFQPSYHALIVDDVLTSGGSILKAIAAAREAGMQVEHALVIVDREEQDGRARVEAQGVKLLSLLTIKDLLSVQGNL